MEEDGKMQESSRTDGIKKKLYLIGGPMGVGKTAVSQCLKKKLDNSVFCISLVCEENVLTQHIYQDIKKGLRTEDVIGRSLFYQSLYAELATEKIDVSDISPEEAALRITNIKKEQVHSWKKELPGG